MMVYGEVQWQGGGEMLGWRKVSELEPTRRDGRGSFFCSPLRHRKEDGASS